MASEGPTQRRSYSQYCAIAHALDLVGERWTLLVVRELLLGPLRYKDLLEGLPGISTNLLARRLHDLEDLGLVERRVLPRPSGSTVYALTATGEKLEPVIIALGRFGGRFLPERHDQDQLFRPRWVVTGLKHTFRAAKATSVLRSYELQIDGEHFHVEVDGDALTARQGEAASPDIILKASATVLLDVLARVTPADEALGSTLTVDIRSKTAGSPSKELTLFISMFGWRIRTSVSPAA